MNPGKVTCEELKKIRKMIADKNNIPYEITECKFSGRCSGTCPFCESEVKYLETQLAKRKSLGKKVLVTGIAVGLSIFASENAMAQNLNNSDSIEVIDSIENNSIEELGEVVVDEDLEGVELVEDEGEFIGYVCEIMPEFPGGEIAVRKFIAEHIRYPKLAMDNDIQGTVFVRFVIDESGKVTNVEILRGVDPLLDEEAVRVVKSLPDWKPGIQRGKNVPIYHTVPVRFKID
ncbi:MAG: energy transducer TonB [Bacteroidales bacterium]|nr:energy transducer TonB [Bacteroidales bacterium]